MDYTTLIDVEQLAARHDDPRWVLLDCRFELTNPAAGEAAFAAGHLPGAQYAHLDRDLAAPASAASGRHPLPAPGSFQALARRWGIGTDSQIVCYEQTTGMFAARAWWLFRWLGHRNVAVLDGGLGAWTAAGLALTCDVTGRQTGDFLAKPQPDFFLDIEDLRALEPRRNGGGHCLVDARSADRFSGENLAMDPVAGHVPGARNHHYARNVGPDGRMLSRAMLRVNWLATLDETPASGLVAMCGSGVSACLNLLALEIAGLPGGKLYPGSWSEWIKDPTRPVERGTIRP